MENIENLEQKNNQEAEEVMIVETIETEVLPESEEPRRRFSVSYKTLIIIGAVIIVAALLYLGKGLFVAATVNGTPISRYAVVSELERSGGQNVLDSMIRERLINDEARNKGIVISEDEINEEIKKVEDSLKEQNMTLDDALAEQKMTRDDLRHRIITQKEITKLVEDKTGVEEKEIDEYIKTNSVTLTKGKEKEERASIKEQLVNQKLSEEAGKLVDQLMADAKINYWVKY